LLPLKDSVQLLAGLPVRELLNIMTLPQKKKRMPPMYVGLLDLRTLAASISFSANNSRILQSNTSGH
jgi:hypothetical protein